jgi:hypothetical protein
MKFISTLFVLIALVSVGTVNAQSTTPLNGTTYTVVMKDAEKGGEEIIDHITFQNGQLVSEKFAAEGYTSGKYLEKAGASDSNFEVTLSSREQGSKVYHGKVTGTMIDGTVTVTNKDGVQTTMAFRGMTTEDWNNLQEQKRAAREKFKQ